MEQVQVVIVDDHVMVREGIKQLLEMDGDIRIIGEASDGEEGIRFQNIPAATTVIPMNRKEKSPRPVSTRFVPLSP